MLRFYCLTIIFLLFSVTIEAKKPIPKADSGKIDITECQLTHGKLLPLDGKWEFYWNKLLTPQDFRTGKTIPSDYVKVPSLWTKYKINGNNLPNYGFATYRLVVYLPDTTNNIALSFNRIETSYKLWVNGKFIAEVGKVGKTQSSTQPKWLPAEYPLNLDTNRMEIIIQVSNFSHKKAGIDKTIKIGQLKTVQNNRFWYIGLDIFIIGVLIIMAFYHFGLFILRTKDKSTLYFAIALLSSAAYTTMNGEFLLVRIFNDFPWPLLVKLNFITNYLRLLFFYLFLFEMFKKHFSRYLAVGLSVASALMIIVTIITPPSVFSHTLIVFIIIAAFAILGMLIGLIKATANKSGGALLSLIGLSVLILAAINDVLFDFGIIQSIYTVTLGLFVFVFIQSFMLAYRTAHSFFNVEKLSSRLLKLDEIKNDVLKVQTYDIGRILKIFTTGFNACRGVFLLNEADKLYISAEVKMIDDSINVYENKLLSDFDKSGYNTFLSKKIIEEVIVKQNVVFISNLEKNTNKISHDEYLTSKQVKSVIGVPIKDNESFKGILYLESRQDKNPFDEENIKILETLTFEMAAMVDNAIIYKELENLNRHLEEIVEQRTAEIIQQKEEIEAQRDEIKRQNLYLTEAYHEIEIKNRDITDSINYAKRIQLSILPSERKIKNLVPNSFVMFRPKDVLSGDFYWFEKVYTSDVLGGIKTEKIIIAVVDCTGHGVPGAFMSLIGNNMLNYAVNQLHITDPAKILDVMQTSLVGKLQTKQTRDGMEVAIAVFEPENSRLIFAGAKRPLYLVRNGDILVYKANKFAIGDIWHEKKTELRYEKHEIQIRKNDVIYMFSDGYVDQFGGKYKRKFMSKRFKTLLQTIYKEDMDIQQKVLTEAFDDWKNGFQQIDDVLVIGAKLI